MHDISHLMRQFAIFPVNNLIFCIPLSVISLSLPTGAKFPLVLSMVALLALSLGAVSMGVIPAFTDDFSRTVNVCLKISSCG